MFFSPRALQNQKTLRKTNVFQSQSPEKPKNIKENQCFLTWSPEKPKNIKQNLKNLKNQSWSSLGQGYHLAEKPTNAMYFVWFFK